MNTKKSENIESDKIIMADRRMVEELYAHGLINGKARLYALDLLYPAVKWALWVSRILLVVGSALVLSGIIYFYAFNWAKITPKVKFISIEIPVIACLAACLYFGLNRISGKMSILAASVLLGVFLAVFGQIYQTGADAFQLFMVWGILILPWVIIARFDSLWLIWLVIVNLFAALYWDQAAMPLREAEFMIFSYLALLNAFFLGIREYFAYDRPDRAIGRWLKVVLTISILSLMLIPIISLIVEPGRATSAIKFGAFLGFIIHGAFLFCYFFKIPDMWVLSLTALSLCVIIEVICFKLVIELFKFESIFFLLLGISTLGIFTGTIICLRKIARNMEARDAR